MRLIYFVSIDSFNVGSSECCLRRNNVRQQFRQTEPTALLCILLLQGGTSAEYGKMFAQFCHI